MTDTPAQAIRALREAIEEIATEQDAGRHDGLPEPCPVHDADTMFAFARAALPLLDDIARKIAAKDAALRECQSALAMMIAPDAIKQSTVLNAFAQATAAEARARAALAGTADPAGFFAGLSAEQREKALAYDGPENHGDPAFRNAPQPTDPAQAQPETVVMVACGRCHGIGCDYCDGFGHFNRPARPAQPETASGAEREVWRPRYRHKKRGSSYELLGIGKMQAEDWEKREYTATDEPVAGCSVDMHEVAIYRAENDGSLWVRPREEFEDGRFEPLPAALEARNG